MSKKFNFNTQLEQGNAGETWFLQNFERKLVKNSTFSVDFLDDLGRRIELKTEMRTLEDTPNFFIERWSNLAKQTPGGPWQSVDKADILVYLFLPSQTYFIFDSLPLLIYELESRKVALRVIENETFSASGYVVKRNSLAHLYRVVSLK